MATRVARQASVVGRIDVLRAHPVARLEPGLRVRGAAERAARECSRELVLRQNPFHRLAGAERAAGGVLVGIDQSLLAGIALEPQGPAVMEGHPEVAPVGPP